jgi:hypothetical protein
VLHFQLILEAIPKAESSQARRYRGYIAVDDLVFKVSNIILDPQEVQNDCCSIVVLQEAHTSFLLSSH